MIEKNKTSNGFANGAEETVTAPIFDVRARQTACRVVPLSLTNFETSYLGATKTNAQTQTQNSQQFQNIPQNINPQRSAVSKPKTKSFLKIFLLIFLIIFSLGAGTVVGFVSAQYQNQKEKFGIALIPQPALNSIKNFPELKLEAFEDPNEIEETPDELMDENQNSDNDSTAPDTSQASDDSRQRSPKQEKRTRTEPDKNEQPSTSSPQEQRDRKVRTKPNQSVTNNNRGVQSKPQIHTPEEFVFEKLKKIIEIIAQD